MNSNEIINIINSSSKNINQILKKIENSNQIYYDIDVKYDINLLYSEKFNRNEFKKIIMIDPWLIILKFHENIFIELNNRKLIKKLKNEFYKKYLIELCYFDYLILYNSDIAIDYFISIIHDIIIIKHKKKINNNLNNFTKILSYLSLQKKNIKLSYNSNFPINQIGNYQSSIINKKLYQYF